MPYDVIIVGARCAGSPLGMLLARAGRSVLVIDRAEFPSDCLSTHFVQPQGAALLAKWGLLDRVVATGCPPLRGMRFHPPAGEPKDMPFPPDVFGLCPRRSVIDNILVEAAREAGAEVRERFSLRDLVSDDEGRVTGIVGQDAAGRQVTESATLVVGADGLHSRTAQLVDAPEYNRLDSMVCAYFSYFSGVEGGGFAEVGGRPGAGLLLFPTHDGLTCIAAVRPVEEFAAYRADVEGMFSATVARFGDAMASRVQAGKREERWFGTADVPHYFRKPYGPGWVLVGDAGLHLDPTMGLGMSKAFSEVEMLAPALLASLAAPETFDQQMQGFHQQRDVAWLPQAQQNVQAASFQAKRPPAELTPYAFGSSDSGPNGGTSSTL